MSALLAPSKRRVEQLASSLATRRGRSALAVALLAGGGGLLYVRHVEQQAAVRRQKRRARLGLDAKGGNGTGDDAGASKAVAKRRPSKGAALQKLLKLLLSIAGPKILALVGLAVARTALSNRLARLQGHLFRAAFVKNVPLFLKNIGENVLLCLTASAIEATSKRCLKIMDLQWQKALTGRIHRHYFQNMTYYKLPYVDHRITNPEQRICEDIPKLSGGLAELVREWVTCSIDAVFYAWQLRSYTKSNKYTVGIIAYVLGAGIATSVFAPSFGSLAKKEQELEGDFRQVHARLRENAEPVAFYGGIAKEGAGILERFSALMRHRMRVLRTQLRHSVVQDFFLKYLASTWAVVLIIGPFFGGHLRPEDNVRGRAAMLSDMRYHTSVIISLFSSTGLLASSSKKFGRLSGYAERVVEAEDAAKQIALDTSHLDGHENIVASDGEIAFEGVQVVTPANATLVKDLTLRVPRGTNLLVTGPNGSGKSSLFRVLGGLWPLAAGTIRKPGGSGDDGLSHDIFYVPQRPYVTVGTLQEQLIYPRPVAEGTKDILDEKVLRELLAAVDLEYLLDRVGMHAAVNWHDTLSLGEQQRLGMARLFYHKPRYAILDECTSGVTIDMEQRFCERVKALGCTCITISHRPALMAFHDLVLSLDGRGGWDLHRGQRSRRTTSASGNAEEGDGSSSDDNVSSAAPSPSRGSPQDIIAQAPPRLRGEPDTVADTRPQIPVRSTVQRWQAVGGLLLGGEGAKARLAMIGAVVLARTLLQDRIASLNGASVEHVLRQDRPAFVRLIGRSIVQSAASALLAPLLRYVTDALAMSWRRRLTAAAHRRYLSGSTFYTASQMAGMQDVDQRVTRDVERLAGDVAELVPSLVKPVLDLAWFSSQLWALTGRRGSAILYLYAALGFGCLRAVTPDFGALAERQYWLEGAFRRLHVRLRGHAESVAFFGGGARQGAPVDAAFQELQGHLEHVSTVRWPYAVADDFFTKQLPNNVTWLLTLMYSLAQTGDFSDTAVQGRLVHDMRYLASVVTNCFGAFGELLGMQKRFVELDGGVSRVTGLLDTLAAADRMQAAAAKVRADAMLASASNGADGVQIEEVDVATPRGKVLARRLTASVRPGHGLLVTGPNGSGKSSLLRILGGLWPLPAGRLALPCADGVAPTRQDIFYVPQKPYTTIGTLREQVIYPLSVQEAAAPAEGEKQADAVARLDKRLDEVMQVVKLTGLIEREGGWAAVASWGDTMSLGEQQRMGMARLFFHAPRFGVLDECTNATSVDVEEALFEHAAKLNITLVTITQRTALVRFHEHELRLADGEGGWTLRRLPQP